MEHEAIELIREYRGTASPETVRRFMVEAVTHLESRARVDTYFPVLASRMVRDRLRALLRAEGITPRDIPEILFVCVHNAGRSQMAAVMTASLGGARVRVRSAGSMPADEVNPTVAAVMQEIGLDLAEEFPKPLTDEAVRAADVVITMGCGDACPVFPGKRYLDWELDDPSGQSIEAVRVIRDDIRGRIETLLREMGILQATSA